MDNMYAEVVMSTVCASCGKTWGEHCPDDASVFPRKAVCANCGHIWGSHSGIQCPYHDTQFKEKIVAKTLSITDDRVKKAAESCPDAKRVLAELFPEVFAPQVQYVVPEAMASTSIPLSLNGRHIPYSIQQRNGGEYSEKGFYLPKMTGYSGSNIEWSVRKDRGDEFVLVGEVKS